MTTVQSVKFLAVAEDPLLDHTTLFCMECGIRVATQLNHIEVKHAAEAHVAYAHVPVPEIRSIAYAHVPVPEIRSVPYVD